MSKNTNNSINQGHPLKTDQTKSNLQQLDSQEQIDSYPASHYILNEIFTQGGDIIYDRYLFDEVIPKYLSRNFIEIQHLILSQEEQRHDKENPLDPRKRNQWKQESEPTPTPIDKYAWRIVKIDIVYVDVFGQKIEGTANENLHQSFSDLANTTLDNFVPLIPLAVQQQVKNNKIIKKNQKKPQEIKLYQIQEQKKIEELDDELVTRIKEQRFYREQINQIQSEQKNQDKEQYEQLERKRKEFVIHMQKRENIGKKYTYDQNGQIMMIEKRKKMENLAIQMDCGVGSDQYTPAAIQQDNMEPNMVFPMQKQETATSKVISKSKRIQQKQPLTEKQKEDSYCEHPQIQDVMKIQQGIKATFENGQVMIGDPVIKDKKMNKQDYLGLQQEMSQQRIPYIPRSKENKVKINKDIIADEKKILPTNFQSLDEQKTLFQSIKLSNFKNQKSELMKNVVIVNQGQYEKMIHIPAAPKQVLEKFKKSIYDGENDVKNKVKRVQSAHIGRNIERIQIHDKNKGILVKNVEEKQHKSKIHKIIEKFDEQLKNDENWGQNDGVQIRQKSAINKHRTLHESNSVTKNNFISPRNHNYNIQLKVPKKQ